MGSVPMIQQRYLPPILITKPAMSEAVLNYFVFNFFYFVLLFASQEELTIINKGMQGLCIFFFTCLYLQVYKTV